MPLGHCRPQISRRGALLSSCTGPIAVGGTNREWVQAHAHSSSARRETPVSKRTKADPLNPSPLDALRELIHRGEHLCDRDRQTEENELYEFKQDALLLLGSIGPDVEALYRHVTELGFGVPYRKSRYSGIPDPNEAYRTLDELVGILRSAEARMLTLQDEGAEQPQQSKSAKPASKATPYSPRDRAVYELIGADKFKHMTNPALYTQFHHRINTKLGEDVSPREARLIFNRIRTHHGFPKSADLKEK